MPYHLPDISEIMAVAETRGEDSDAPHLWRGLEGAWPLQEPGGVTAFDVVARRNGTLTNIAASARSLGPIGRSVVAAGSSQAIHCSSFLFDLSVSTFTFSTWFTRTSSSTAILFSQKGAATLGLLHNGTNWSLQGAAGASRNWNWTADSAWHHLCLTVDRTANSTLMYIDPVPLAESGTANDSNPTQSYLVYGGRNGTACWIGSLALGTVYSRVLSPTEIRQHYADPWAMYRLRASVFPAAVAEPVLTYRNYILGGGVF